MIIKLRAKTGGRLEAFDEAGNKIEGFKSVHVHCDRANPVPVITATIDAEIVIDGEAKIEEPADLKSPVPEQYR